MDLRINNLILAFENNGWANENCLDIANDWWFKEIIQLKSTWSPVDRYIYLTLLTDPYFLHQKIVWNIGISETIPDRNGPYIQQITLNDIKKTDLNLFAKTVNAILDKNK